MGKLDIISQAIYWFAKIYFMIIGIVYLLVLRGYIKLETFGTFTGIVGVLFLVSNIYWYFLRK